MVEYGLLVALIALTVMAGASMLGQGIGTGFDRATAALAGLPAAADEGDPPEDAPEEPAAAAEADGTASDGGDAAAGGGDAAAGGGTPPKGKSADAPGHGDGSGGGKNHKK